MKLKYYLRGLGIGIIVTTIILAISFGGKQKSSNIDIDKIPEEEIIAKATMLGMVMPESTEEPTEVGIEDEAENQNIVDESLNNIEDTVSEDTASTDTENVSDQAADAGASDSQDEVEMVEISSDNRAPYRLVVNRGDVCRTICEDLATNGLIDDSEVLRKYLLEIGVASFISVGSYDIPYNLSYEEVAEILEKGPIEEQE